MWRCKCVKAFIKPTNVGTHSWMYTSVVSQCQWGSRQLENQKSNRSISHSASDRTDSRADRVMSVNKRCSWDGPQMVIFTLTDKHHYCVWQLPSWVEMSHQSLATEHPKPQQRPSYTSWHTATLLLEETARRLSQWAEERPAEPSQWVPVLVLSTKQLPQ